MKLVSSTRVTDLEAEAGAIEAWNGRNLYSDFLRKNRRRPDRSEAATIGKLMGTSVLAADGSMRPIAFPYIYRWNMQGRKGQPCAITARSLRGAGRKNFNSIRVEFPDGFIMITSGNAIRRARA